MKKIICSIGIVLILVVAATAIELSLSNTKPQIIDVEVTPLKVRPGIPLEIKVKAESNNEIDSAFATFNYENGSDTLRMIRTYSNKNIEEFTAVWLTHDTLDQEWYTTYIIVTDKSGKEIKRTVDWQDPVVTHNWSELEGSGFCILSLKNNGTQCPDGYTSFGTNNRILRVNSSNVGGTGGDWVHRHYFNGTTSTSIPYESYDQGSSGYHSNSIDKEHDHMFTNTPSNFTTSIPGSFNTVICCRN